MRLILFSGGVESTALMTQANPDDIALVVQPTFHNDWATYRKATAEQIAKRYGVRVVYARAEIPHLGADTFVHQMTTFVSLASLMVARNPRIKEVWCGRNSSEPSGDIKGYIERNMAAWALLHPTVPFLHPLDHLSKPEQWAMIPEEVRPLVSSCIYHSMCGRCYKCKEWLCLSESSPSATSA